MTTIYGHNIDLPEPDEGIVTDVVILLHREIMGDKTGDITFSIAKNRHGRTAPVNLEFAGHYSQVRDKQGWPRAA